MESVLWTVLYIGWVVLEISIAFLTRTQREEGKVQDRGTQIVLWLAIVMSLTVGGWLHAVHTGGDRSGLRWLRPASLALFVVGLAVRVTAIVTLGRAFSANVAIRASQSIQRSGLYRLVRHPSYLGMEIIFLAIGLHSRDWLCLLIDFVPPTAAVLYRIHVEEIALRGAFGDEYVEYSRTTRRLLPGIY